MKKMIIPAIAALLFCGAANAQITQKPVAKNNSIAMNKSTAQKPVAKTTTSVTPAKTTTTTTTKTKPVGIHRKHHAKPKKAKVKAKKQ